MEAGPDREAVTDAAVRSHSICLERLSGVGLMRCAFALGLLIALCASADAATVHRSKPPGHGRPRIIVGPEQRVTAPAHFALPGWSDEQTQEWLDNASRGSHEG